jgi:catechol 2,3-dioxygenase-like lactoylglutathione lyase family enzyme
LKTHVALNVANLEKSLDFYKRMLAAEPAKAHADYAKFDLQEPPLNLSLNATSEAEKGMTLSSWLAGRRNP